MSAQHQSPRKILPMGLQRDGLGDLDRVALKKGYSLEGTELEDYCRKRGLCPLCGQTKIKKKVFRLFHKTKWELVTEFNKDGSYRVYKGCCVKSTCFTLEQAKRMMGDAVFPTPSKRMMLRQQSRDRMPAEDSDDDSHAEEYFPKRNHAVHKPSEGAFPPPELRQELSNLDGDDHQGGPMLVILKAIEGLHPSSSTIKIMELSGLKLRTIDFEVLAKGLKVSTVLTTFIFENSELNDANFGILASGLDAAKDLPLKKLYLRTNLIGDAAMEALGPFLQANTTLEKFDISRNSITSSGAFAIFAAFIHNRLARIRSLNMSENKLGKIDDDVSGIGPFLERNRSIRILNLEGTGLEDGSIEALADGLKRNEHTALERLFLGWNTIGDVGAMGLATMLETNKSIRTIALGENVIQNAGARALLACLDVNFTLKDISGLWRNMIQRRFFVVAIRKLLLSDDRKNSQQETPQEQAPSDNVDRTSVVDTGFELQDVFDSSEVDSDGGSGLSSLTNDHDAPDTHSAPLVHPSSPPQLLTSIRSDPTRQSCAFHYDRLVVLQSTPLIIFDRDSAVNRPIQLFDFDNECAKIQENLCQSTSDIIATEFHIATLDAFSAFFQKKSDAHILHFSCTGPTDHLALENGFGAVQTLSFDDLKRLVFYMNIDLTVVVVSSLQARAMSRALIDAGVQHVVCCEHDQQYSDPVVIDFLENFYRAAAGRKNLKQAFQIAWSAVAKGTQERPVRQLLSRFQLLPKRAEADSYHNIPVFFEKSMTSTRSDDNETRIDPPIPPVAEHFMGREVEIYDILNAIRAVDVIRVVGPPRTGKESVVSATCHYAWKRREMLKIDQLLWIPAPDSVESMDDTLNGALNSCASILRNAASHDLWQTNDKILEYQKRIELDVEETRCLVVVDLQKFDTRYAQVGVEQLISFLLNFGTSKVLLIEESRGAFDGLSMVSNISATSRDSLRFEEATIEIHPLDFKSSALLFGKCCPFIASGRCPAAHTAAEFADLLEPTKQPESALATKRRSDLFERIGLGYPEAIRAAAVSMDGVEFMELILIAVRPEVFVDSLASLDLEVERRTMEQILAVDDKNYHRAHSLDQLLEDMEMLRPEFPNLELLKKEQNALNQQLDEAVRMRRYDMVNDLKRELLGIKRKIRKEQQHVSDMSSVATNEKIHALTHKVHTMVLESQSSFKPKWTGGPVTFVVSCGDHRDCSFVISVGKVWDFPQSSAGNGTVCWTNECCHLEGTVMGDPLLRIASAALRLELSELAEITTTPYGSVRCVTGNAVVVGPANFGAFTHTHVLLAVGPFSPSPWEGDADDDTLATPESVAYAKCMLRSCYRCSVVLAKHSGLRTLTLSLSTPPEGSQHYTACLQLGLQTLVDEVPFSHLRDLNLIAQSPQEAALLKSMLEEMGYLRRVGSV